MFADHNQKLIMSSRLNDLTILINNCVDSEREARDTEVRLWFAVHANIKKVKKIIKLLRVQRALEKKSGNQDAVMLLKQRILHQYTVIDKLQQTFKNNYEVLQIRIFHWRSFLEYAIRTRNNHLNNLTRHRLG